MNPFTYWKDWQKPYQILFAVLLVLLAGSILYFLLSFYKGSESVIQWAVSPVMEAVQVPLPSWQHPLLDVQVLIDTYVVKQTFWGTPFQVNTRAAAVSLGIFLLALAVALTAITTFNRLWYLVSATGFCAIIMLLRLEQLGVWGRFDTTAALVVFALTLPLSYFFHAVRRHTSFWIRLISFLALFALLAGVLGYYATVSYPYLYVMNYGLPAWLALSMLLLILVGPEIIVGILYLITANATPDSKGSLRHFSIASGLYLANLILYYLEERQYLDLDLYLIGPYWILLISIVVGLWTLRLRSEHLSAVMRIDPYGLLLYIALAMLTLSTMAYAAATANDSLLETFEDAILYTHLGMGVAFVLYILGNFYALLRQNQRVYRVLYQPKYMPLFSARLVGLIAIVGFYAVRGNYGYFQTMAGYYNAIGDIYAVQNDLIVSQSYYRLGSQYHVRNHRSNYALASLAMGAQQAKPAMLYLQEALERQPTPYTYANLANLYRQRGLYFETLFTLKKGISAFPQAGQLYNNLGLSYGVTQMTDSAFYFLQAAAADNSSENAALANMLAVLAQKGISLSPDSLLRWEGRNDLALQNNLMALANRQGYQLKGLGHPSLLIGNDSSMVVPNYLLNYVLQTRQSDPTLLNVVRQGYEKAKLSALEEQWGLAYALMLYQQPDYYTAFAAMQDLADRSQFNNITYYKILGQWALEQQAPQLAAEWFQQAYMRGDRMAGFYRAMALAEAGKPEEAADLWLSLPDSALPTGARQRKTQALLALSNTPLEELPGAAGVASLRLRLRPSSLISAEINELLNTVSAPAERAAALLYLTRHALQQGNRPQAQQYFSQLQPLQNRLLPDQQQLLSQLALRYQLKNSRQAAEAEMQLPPLLRLQHTAAQELAAKDTTEAIEALSQVAKASPFEEQSLLLLSQLLNKQKKEEKAYAVLRQALQLNQHSLLLLEAYALQSLRMGLEAYAEEALVQLETTSPPERYRNFIIQYERIKESQSKRLKW